MKHLFKSFFSNTWKLRYKDRLCYTYSVNYHKNIFPKSLFPVEPLQHPDNSWCTQEFADSLQLAIYDFYDWCLSGNLNILISINDMCLPYGGRFDVNGRWGGRNDQAHYYHRVGTSVDLNRTLTPEQIEKLEDYMQLHSLVRHPERPMIHFGIMYRDGSISY